VKRAFIVERIEWHVENIPLRASQTAVVSPVLGMVEAVA
jgi:hypothetical protein